LILEHAIREGVRDFYVVPSAYDMSKYMHDYFKTGEGLSGRLGLEHPAKIHHLPRNVDKGDGDAFFRGFYYYRGQIGDKFVLFLNGDNINSIGFGSMLERKEETGADIVLAVKKIEGDLSPFGTVAFDLESYGVSELREKSPEPASMYIYTGIGLFSPEFFRKVDSEMQDIFHREKIGMSNDVISEFIKMGLGRVAAYDTLGKWSDVGTPTAFLETTRDILYEAYRGIDFGPHYIHILDERGVEKEWHVHRTTYERIRDRIGKDVILKGKGLIGADCDIGCEVTIQDSVVGHSCSLGDGSMIRTSSISKLTRLGREIQARGTIVGVFCDIGSTVRLQSGSVIGNNVALPQGSTIKTDQRVALLKHKPLIQSADYQIEGEDSENIYFRK